MKRKTQLVYPDHQPEKDKGKGRRLRGIRRIPFAFRLHA